MKFPIPIHAPTCPGGAQHWNITRRFAVDSPTSEAAVTRGTADVALATSAAGISKSPVEKAAVRTPFRTRVSFHPRRMSRSEIQPPRGALDAPHQVGKRSVSAGLQKSEVPYTHKVVGKPGNQEILVISIAEKTQATSQQVAIEVSSRGRGLCSGSFFRRRVNGGVRILRGKCQQPGKQPQRGPGNRRGKTWYASRSAPSARQRVAPREPVRDACRSRKAARQPAVARREKRADEFHAARKINGFSHAEDDAHQDQRCQAAHSTRQAAGH